MIPFRIPSWQARSSTCYLLRRRKRRRKWVKRPLEKKSLIRNGLTKQPRRGLLLSRLLGPLRRRRRRSKQPTARRGRGRGSCLPRLSEQPSTGRTLLRRLSKETRSRRLLSLLLLLLSGLTEKTRPRGLLLLLLLRLTKEGRRPGLGLAKGRCLRLLCGLRRLGGLGREA